MEQALIKSARTDKFYWVAVLLIALAAGGIGLVGQCLYACLGCVSEEGIASVTVLADDGAVAGIAGDYSSGRCFLPADPADIFAL